MNGGTLPSLFDRFWAAYPRRDAKRDARKAFAAQQPDEALLETMLTALAWQRDSAQWTIAGGRYVPYAATWLRGGRWEDERMVQTREDVTDAELRAALEIRRRAFGRCPHEPAHVSATDCARQIAMERKTA